MKESRAELSPLEKASYWREVVSRFESSGLSQSEFSRREGLLKSRLNYWLRKFRSTSPGSSSFVELPSIASPSGANFSEIELEFPSGLSLRIRG